jgi:membrane-associated HD superfamily phosphohydrolase
MEFQIFGGIRFPKKFRRYYFTLAFIFAVIINWGLLELFQSVFQYGIATGSAFIISGFVAAVLFRAYESRKILLISTGAAVSVCAIILDFVFIPKFLVYNVSICESCWIQRRLDSMAMSLRHLPDLWLTIIFCAALAVVGVLVYIGISGLCQKRKMSKIK